MKEIIENFIKELSFGLYILCGSTGCGKTHITLDLIFRIAEEYKKKGIKIFFVTPLIKNVKDPYDKLKELFVKQGKEDWFNENVIHVKSVLDAFLAGTELIDQNKDSLFQTSEFIEIKLQYDLYKRNESNPELKKMISEQLATSEASFRKIIEDDLTKEKGETAKKNYFRKKHPELLKLYPTVLSDEKTVFFMSFRKFYSKNITLINKSDRFINLKLTDNALVFLDEIDSCKSWALNAEIEEQTKANGNGNIALFHSIRNGISRHLPSVIYNYQPTKQEESLPKAELEDVISRKQASLRKLYKEMRNVINETDQDIHFSDAFKVVNPNMKRKYIYNSQLYITFADNKNRCDIIVEWDKEGMVNNITFIPLDDYKKYTDEHKNAKRMTIIMARIKGADKYFTFGVGNLAENYCKWINANKGPNEDERTLSDSIASILRPLGITDEKVINMIMERFLGEKKIYNIERISTSLYEKGIRYFEFLDGKRRDCETEIKEYAIEETPELFLYQLAKKAHVIGLSATGLIPSNISNFDLKYLKMRLGNNFYIPSKDEVGRMNQTILDRFNNNKSKITVNSIDGNDAIVQMKDRFIDEKDYYSTKKKIEIESAKLDENNDGTYFRNRYMKMLDAIFKYIDSNAQVHLSILNNNFKDGDLLYGEEFIKHLLVDVGHPEIEVISLISSDFDARKEKYLNLAKEGKRVLLLASFASCSAGQNLFYEVDGDKYDISSLYVERPTNVLVNPMKFDPKKDNTKDLLNYFYQIESIAENNEIDYREKEFYIRKAFHHLNGEKCSRTDRTDIYQTKTVLYAALSYVTQGIGRISRVVDKNSDIETNIYLDRDILEKLDFSIFDNDAINKELRAVVDYQKNNDYKVKEITIPQNIVAAVNNNRYYESWINQQLSTPWRVESMDLWMSLRRWLIKNPFKNSFCEDELNYKNFYFESTEVIDNYYIYKKPENEKTFLNDYEISVTPKDKYHKVFDNTFDLLEGNVEVVKWFNELEYPTRIEPSKYLMLPCFFKQIYNGILGEELGRLVFKNKLGIDLNEIKDPTIFEKFDFVIDNNYVDFKMWNDNGKELPMEHIKEKLDSVSGKQAFIINIYGNNSEDIHQYGNVYVIPSIIDRNTFEFNVKALMFINKMIRSVE